MSDSATIRIRVDGHNVDLEPGQSVLVGARKLGIDIPTLCYLEKCGPQTSCLACVVKINGKLVPSCATKATPGMIVESETDEVHEARRTALELLFSDHVGDCLSPCHRLCPLGLNIPVMLRQIQTGKLEEAAATVRDALPLPAVLGRLCHHPCEQGCRRGTWDAPAAIREEERFVADWAYGFENGNPSANYPSRAASLPVRQPPSGKSVVIIGTGPTGLAAAYQLLRDGHACTLVDRHEAPGGSLRQLNESELPCAVVDAEIATLTRLGAEFKLGIALGRELTLDGLRLGFDAILLGLGELSKAEGEALGLSMAPGGIKINATTYQTDRPEVFAAGRAVKPTNHLVKAMAEGVAATERIHQFLRDEPIVPGPKAFSNVMGRLDREELSVFIRNSEGAGRINPCDTCAGFNRKEAAIEGSRCLHCDCRSSGDCALQSYAQLYEVNASKYRQQRRSFEQFVQTGGIIFEPGKCIRCGICVKLAEMAREPLGLTFIGRGFDVKIAAPFGKTIEEGLQIVAQECVDGCPTGALAFR
jgi:ferredoxin